MRLALEKLRKHYGEKVVLDGLTYTFPEEGIVWVRGPSGCGKTTLLRLIAGLERPDAGRILLPERARLSVVFQEDRLLETLTARDNLLAVLGGKTPETRVLADRCLERCGLGGEGERYPFQLSGGMRRRVAIARAMAFGGDLLLLDEPFKGLDRPLREQVMDFVFGGGQRLTLLVTHDAEEAACAVETLELG